MSEGESETSKRSGWEIGHKDTTKRDTTWLLSHTEYSLGVTGMEMRDVGNRGKVYKRGTMYRADDGMRYADQIESNYS